MKKIIAFAFALIWSFTSHAALISSSVQINGQSYSADWFIPDGTANGLVFLQHGFTANKGNMRDMGNELMDANMMVLAITSSVTGGNFSLANAIAQAFSNDEISAPNGIALPQKLVLAGHSAGGLHVSMIGKYLVESGYNDLAGVILFDPVEASGGMASAFPSLSAANVPVYGILANAGFCNSSNNAAPIMANIDAQNFVGMKLTFRSSHLDSYGTNTNFFQSLFCGFPTSDNIASVQGFTRAWASDMFTGSFSSDYYPGGSAMSELLNSNRASLLK